MESLFLHDYRCGCGKLLFKGALLMCRVEIKCKRCGAINVMEGMSSCLGGEGCYTMLMGKNADILNVSESATKILGYSREELLTMRAYDIGPLLPRETYGRLWNTMRSGKESFVLETVQRKKNGETMPVKLRVRFSKLGDMECVFAIADSSRGVAQNVAARDSEPSSLVDYNCDLRAEVSARGIYTYMGAKSADLLGYASGEVLGRTIFEFCFPREADIRRREFAMLATAEQPFRILNDRVLHKDGRAVTFDTYFVPRYGEHGGFIGYGTMGWLSTACDTRGTRGML
jgi:PAS domain S-box-containing protein